MEYMENMEAGTQGNILCCECGVVIQPNPSNMCVACLRTQVDITEGIPKQGVIYFCRNCERYLQPPATWVVCSLESRELLALCLKKLKGLNNVRLVDAGFVWTEPHSKRIKVKLSIQKEVLGGAILQQVFIVEFTVQYHMCEDCHRVEAKDFWKACVQVRQKTQHKKTFLYLEQLMLKHGTHTNTVNIKENGDGMDFFYGARQDARKLVEFLESMVPSRYKMSQKLISHDTHSNTYNYKYTYSVEIVPICKDNIVCLSPKLAQSLAGIGQICVCLRVSSIVHLIDPNTLQVADVTSSIFWRMPFQSICELRHLTEFTVMDIEPFDERKRKHVAGAGHRSTKHQLADVWVMRTCDMGVSDQQHHCRTHLGHLLKPGDLALGFDFTSANLNNEYINKMDASKLPDIVLVKKHFDRQRRNRRRNWKLNHMTKETEAVDEGKLERDYSEFLEDLEEDEAYRQNVNIYLDPTKSVAVETDDDDDAPRISLQEMMQDLHLDNDGDDQMVTE